MEDHRKKIYRVLIFMMGITLVCGQLCKNCLNGCVVETRVCSGGCTAGWDGPTCSRRNVAFHQNATQSSEWRGFGSSLAVDGRTGHDLFITPHTCTHTDVGLQEANWTVTLDARYNIHRFRIYNRNEWTCRRQCGARLNGFTLSVGNYSSQSYEVCYQDNTTDPRGPGDTIDEVCNVSGPVLGDIVRIMINNFQPLTLCEVQIFVCTNGTYGSDCEERCENCAEGPSVCDTISGHCPPRTLTCMAGYLPPKCDTVCNNGTYGPDCESKCGNCVDGPLVCNTASGHCPDRTAMCMPGYLPPKCDTACSSGTYGTDCERKCGNCADGPSVCDTTSGHCPQGTPRCMPGYLPPKCDTECTNNGWGNDCLEVCGQCYNKAVCDAITGDCPLAKGNPRCDIGYSGTHCISLSHLKDSPPDYTGVIAGSAGGLSVVVIIGVIIIVVMIRRNSRNVQTGGTVRSGPNSTPTQESGVPPEVLNRSQMPDPSSLYNTCDTNSHEDHSYEAIRHYANLDCSK